MVEQANSDPLTTILVIVVLISGLEVPLLHRVSISFAGAKSQSYFQLLGFLVPRLLDNIQLVLVRTAIVIRVQILSIEYSHVT